MKYNFKTVNLKKYLFQVLLATGIIAVSLVLDLWSKAAVVEASADWPMKELTVIDGFFSLHYVTNTGAAFSLGAGCENFYSVVIPLTFLILAAIMFALYFYTDKRHVLFITGLSLIFSGALGNLIDRMWLGYVRDFLDFIIFGWDFAVFNVADSCLVVGVIVILVWIIAFYRPESKKEEEKGNSESEPEENN